MATTPEQFARKMATLGPRMNKNVADSVGKAALVIKTSVQANLVSAIGPEMRMSGVGRKSTARMGGAKVGVRYDVKGQKNPTALLRMTGPAHLIERDTRPHVILPRGVGRVQGRRTKANRRAAKQELYSALFGGDFTTAGAKPLSLGGGRFAYRVDHPGTKGKKPFERGVTRARPVAERILRDAVGKSLGEVFR